MKMSIDWHRECLMNMNKSLASEEELARVAARVERYRFNIHVYDRQNREAVAKGKDGFDSERFGKNQS